jgi:hypothetical protein
MSGVGACPRVLGAMRLGYSTPPMEQDDIDRLKHYTRMEIIATAQIAELGYEIQDDGLCLKCKNELGNERYGIHVQIETPLYDLIGHMDRRVKINDKWYPVEIKSANKDHLNSFKNYQFRDYPGYAGQECCYLEAESQREQRHVPGLYWMIERDSGRNVSYRINDINDELACTGFPNVNLPITFDEILDKLNLVELEALEGKLLPGVESNDCWFCDYKFLCEKKTGKTVDLINIPHLVDASDTYKQGIEMEKKGQEMKSIGVATLINYAKTNGIEKFKTPTLSISYRGQKTKKWLDETTIRQGCPEEVVRLAERQSHPYDDYTIRSIGKKE